MARAKARATVAFFLSSCAVAGAPGIDGLAFFPIAIRLFRARYRVRACAARAIRCERVIAYVTGIICMQSTGHGGMHNSQPVQSAAITVCITFAAPAMASTGQACMHSVQPMHHDSSIIATAAAWVTPHEASSGLGACPNKQARSSITAMPPGGQRLMSAVPAAIAAAYGRQPA